MVQDKLSAGDFLQVANAVPGIDSLLNAAAAGDEGGGGLLGSFGSMIQDAAGGQIGDLAGLIGGFSKLGLDADMIGKFTPVILEFVQNQGGEGIAALVKKALG